jgi:hypothetical protein
VAALILLPLNCVQGPFSRQILASIRCLFSLMVAILTEVRENRSVALVCISLTAEDSEHFFVYVLAHSTSALRTVYSTHLPIY